MKVPVSVDVTGVTKYDFTGDDGREVKMCKLYYQAEVLSDNNIGIKTIPVVADLKYFNLFMGQHFPCKATLELDITDLSKKPVVMNISISK